MKLFDRSDVFRKCLRGAFFVAALWACTSISFAQENATEQAPDASADRPLNPAAVRFGDPVRSVWEFGLSIETSGSAKRIAATVPVPMDWPEQSIRVLKEEKSASVGKLRHSQPTKETQQMEFNVNRLAAGESAMAFQQFEILRRPILKPSDTSSLKIARPVPGRLKRFTKPGPYIESTHRRIRAIAKELKVTHAEATAWSFVEAIYQYVRENVEYEFDTQIHSCLEALDAGKGDCEELSSLFIAICRASDIPARAVWIPGHTYPEFYLVDAQGTGHWYPCQAAGGYEFGEMNEKRPVLQKGDRFKLPGERKPVRYVRPTLLAREADGEIKIEWISRDVTRPVQPSSVSDNP